MGILAGEQSITLVAGTLGSLMALNLFWAYLRRTGRVRARLAGALGLSATGSVRVARTTELELARLASVTVRELTERARAAAVVLAQASRVPRTPALHAMADALAKAETAVLDANARDVERAEDGGTSDALIDRLRLNPDRVAGMVDGLRDLARLPDPVGDVVRGWTNANGVQVRQVRVPFGVVGIIYEARPNVTADAGGICLKSGNAALLRGSSSAADSNAAIVEALRAGWRPPDLPADAVQLVPGPREVTAELMAARGLVDVLIPRGGAGLIDASWSNSQVPVIETGVGNCHLYVDATADQDDGARRSWSTPRRSGPRSATPRRPCWCTPTRRTDFLPRALAALAEPGSRCTATTGWPRTGRWSRRPRPTSPTSTCRSTWRPRWSTSLDDALAHIRRYSHRAQRDDHHRVAARGAAVRRRGRRRGRAGQRVQPVRRRRRVRLRRRDRHLHPEAACPRPDGPAGDDLDQVRGDRRRADPLRSADTA